MTPTIPRKPAMPHSTADLHKTLTDCGRAHLAATNGHHRRWAAKRCTDALIAAGTTPSIAAQCAAAMAAVAQAVALRASA